MATSKTSFSQRSREERLLLLLRNYSENSRNRIAQILNSISPGRIAQLLESSPPKSRQLLWHLLNNKNILSVMTFLSEEVWQSLLEQMEYSEIVPFITEMDESQMALTLKNLPPALYDEVKSHLPERYIKRLEAKEKWGAATVGARMVVDIPVLTDKDKTYAAIEYILHFSKVKKREFEDFPIIDTNGRYLGTITWTKLVAAPKNAHIHDFIDSDVEALFADEHYSVLNAFFQTNGLKSIPVVDENENLVGQIRRDVLLGLLYSTGEGLEEDTFASFSTSAPIRFFWLLINLATALLATVVISQFSEILAEVVALAILMPIVTSMGGIAATQTLAVVLRGLVLDEINAANINWLFNRELIISISCGGVLSLLIGYWAYLWFNNPDVAFIMGTATWLNILIAAISGVTVPLVMRALNFDPAVSGVVVVTTITDIAGFTIFLGGASLILTT